METSPNRLLIVFLKAPVPGEVKTRLCPPLTPDEAAAVYRRLVGHTLQSVSGLSPAPALWLYHTPPDASGQIQDAFSPPAHAIFKAQPPDTDLGQRLEFIFHAAFAAGFQHVAAIGTDCAELAPAHLEQAFAALERNPVVLGPAHDGGYYLIALSQPAPALFRGIPWSTEYTLTSTLAAAHREDLPVTLLDWLHDVDTPADLDRFPALRS